MTRRNSTPKPLRLDDYKSLAAYRHALRQFLHFSTEAARAAGLTQQQYQVLLAIKSSPHDDLLSIGQLAESMLLRHHSAVGLVDRLVRRRLLRRVPDGDDGRRVRIRMTAGGEKLLGRLAAIHRDELRRLGPQLVRALQSLGVK